MDSTIDYEKFILRKAKVIDINDDKKKGRIKIQVMPDMKGVSDESLLPWSMPFNSINSTTIMSNDLPEKNSIIRVLVREDWQRFYYLSNIYFYENFDFSKVTDKLDKVSNISGKEYKDIVFRLYLDGSLDFHNNNTGEHGYVTKDGSYFYFNSDGYFDIKDTKNNEVISSSDGLKLVDTNNNKVETTSSGISIIDKNNNKIVSTSSGVEIDDSNGNKIIMGTASVKINGNFEVLK